MKNYYIYHIAGIKIGCTVNVPHRMREQGFTEWEHLETHTDIYEASNREIELQKEYGYPVDKIPYYLSVQNRPKWDGRPPSKQCVVAGGRAHKGIPKSEEWKAQKPWLKSHEVHMIKTECPHCNKSVDKRNYGRWHGDNCKLA